MFGQDRGEPISAHVKEVHREQTEHDAKGAWFKVTATLETKTATYSVECQEYYDNDENALTVRCFELTAGKDYSGRKLSDTINFWQPKDSALGTLAFYSILSEKQRPKEPK